MDGFLNLFSFVILLFINIFLKVNSLVKKFLIDIYEIDLDIVDGIWNFVFILNKNIIFGSNFYVNIKLVEIIE